MRRTEGPRSAARVFIEGAQLQIIVIGAVMMREIHTRYGRENLGFVWLVAEPLLFCMGVIGIWMGIHGRFEHGLPILAFVVTGYLPLTLWRHVTNRAVQCFRANAPLLYHRQVKLLDLLIARVLLEFYGTLIAYAVIAFVFYTVDMYELPQDWGLFLLGWFYFLVFSMAAGLIIGSLTELYEWSEKLVGPFMYFMLPICGAFFMVDWLPYRLQRAAVYVPTVDAFELIRSGQFGPSVRVYYDLPYETFICTALFALGIILCRNVHRHLVFE
jgi:capsular polysaccharide transport system permease protein